MSRASVAMGSRTLVEKYGLGRTLGEGSFAKVKFARNTQSSGESAIAIKIIDRHRVLSSHMVEQARQGKLEEGVARRYSLQLIDAVDYCHSRGVYHRDLKPDNLLLYSHGFLKVSDFGLSAFSKQVREDGLFHTDCGTPNYVAPEVLNDKGYDGTTSDVWSCGVILFVLMSGCLPFDKPNLMALYWKRITISEIIENDWFKEDYMQPCFRQEEDVNLDDVDALSLRTLKTILSQKEKKNLSP